MKENCFVKFLSSIAKQNSIVKSFYVYDEIKK